MLTHKMMIGCSVVALLVGVFSPYAMAMPPKEEPKGIPAKSKGPNHPDTTEQADTDLMEKILRVFKVIAQNSSLPFEERFEAAQKFPESAERNALLLNLGLDKTLTADKRIQAFMVFPPESQERDQIINSMEFTQLSSYLPADYPGRKAILIARAQNKDVHPFFRLRAIQSFLEREAKDKSLMGMAQEDALGAEYRIGALSALPQDYPNRNEMLMQIGRDESLDIKDRINSFQALPQDNLWRNEMLMQIGENEDLAPEYRARALLALPQNIPGRNEILMGFVPHNPNSILSWQEQVLRGLPAGYPGRDELLRELEEMRIMAE